MNDSVEENDSVDLILRHVSHRFPEDLARGLLGVKGPLSATVLETQIASRHRELDRTLDVEVKGERRLLHLEWQGDMPANMPFRSYEYQSLMALAVAAESRAGSQLVPPIESVVVLLGGRAEPWPPHGSYRLSPPDAPFSGVHFRIEPVYQRTVAELAARGPFWLIFAPLALDADEPCIRRVMEDLRAQVSPEAFEELGVAMAVLAEADQRGRDLRSVVRTMLPRELVMQNWIYKEGLEDGRQKGREEGLQTGLAPLAHQFERRLRRPLTPTERATLAERLLQQGAERLGDVVLDLSPEDLATWLAATNGH
ncbi:hypothetical protein [Polyangium sorediatum]|uniref:DUF4351 domain-containing protein n=1 Tax=Polyangium sorediatum TaxID=889274 RepID=A0ABT6NQV9_9BACT|nr:hypothetical protein [Polyangium sorediatum]MDI1430717.1 hypothetical protein [Polyangium sorediatum]